MRIFKALAAVAFTAITITVMVQIADERSAPVAVEGILPEITTVYDSLTLRGSVTELDRRELLPPAPARVTAVYAKVGQRVFAGQVLLELTALTEQTDTRAAVYNDIESAVSAIIEESLSGSANDYKNQGSELAAAAANSILQAQSADVLPVVFQIISPIDGIVMEIAPVGTSLSGIRPCAAVTDLTRLAVSAQAGEDIVGSISEGMECTVSIDALGLEEVAGHVELVMPYARQTGGIAQAQQTKTEVIILLDGELDSLRPGYSATAKIAVNMKPDAVVAPFTAIGQDAQNNEYVMVLQSGHAVKKYIQTGRELSDCAEVVSGIEAGELLILSPEKLSHGQKVVIR